MNDPQLEIYAGAQHVGSLVLEDAYRYRFTYAPEWLNSANARAIGHVLPLQAEPHRGYYVQNFFANLLPEGAMRQRIVQALHLADRDFPLLQALGRDCAGALSLVSPGEAPPTGESSYLRLSDAELSRRLKGTTPISTPQERWSLSLAGAQGKMALLMRGGTLFMPQNGAPTNCIVKTASADYPDIVLNEYLCLRLAAQAGLPVPSVSLRRLQDESLLVVRRYDRAEGKNGEICRLHQEDFCQLLGLSHETKYEFFGGPSLADCAAVLREVSSLPIIDTDLLAQWYTYNLLIGNMDGHAKNISVLHTASGTRLAPFYDLVHTLSYPHLRREPAMLFGGEALPIERITYEAWADTLREAGVNARRAEHIGKSMTAALLRALDAPAEPESPAASTLRASVRRAVVQTAARLRFGGAA